MLALQSSAQEWLINEEDVHSLRKINSGSEGQVFKGRYKGATVALKEMLAVLVSGSDDIDAFCHEVGGEKRSDSRDETVRNEWPGVMQEMKPSGMSGQE